MWRKFTPRARIFLLDLFFADDSIFFQTQKIVLTKMIKFHRIEIVFPFFIAKVFFSWKVWICRSRTRNEGATGSGRKKWCEDFWSKVPFTEWRVAPQVAWASEDKVERLGFVSHWVVRTVSRSLHLKISSPERMVKCDQGPSSGAWRTSQLSEH